MATKSTPRSTAKQSSPRKPGAKKTPARKVAPKKRASAKSQSVKSFHVEHSSTPFLTIAITRQTLYWTILSVAVLALGMWILHLQNEINKIYDAIEVSMIESDSVIISSAPKKQ